jgi:hypothetical protein
MWIKKPENRGLRLSLAGVAMGFLGVGGAFLVYEVYGTELPDIYSYLVYSLVIPGFLLAVIGGIMHWFLFFGNKAKSEEKRENDAR